MSTRALVAVLFVALVTTLPSCRTWRNSTTAPAGTFRRETSFLLLPVEIELVPENLNDDARRDAAAIYEGMAAQCTEDTLLACTARGVNVSRTSSAPDFRLRIRFTREEATDTDEFGRTQGWQIVSTLRIERPDGTVVESARRTKAERQKNTAKSISAFVEAMPTYVSRYLADAVGAWRVSED